MSELVDLSKLEKPKVIEDLSFENLLAQRKKRLLNCIQKKNAHFGKHG